MHRVLLSLQSDRPGKRDILFEGILFAANTDRFSSLKSPPGTGSLRPLPTALELSILFHCPLHAPNQGGPRRGHPGKKGKCCALSGRGGGLSQGVEKREVWAPATIPWEQASWECP